MWSYRESIRLFLNLAWMEPDVLRQTLEIPRFIGGAECAVNCSLKLRIQYEFCGDFVFRTSILHQSKYLFRTWEVRIIRQFHAN